MVATGRATPLIGLDAVVIDTETTGLDARKARIIQLGAVSISDGSVDDTQTFEQLINPGIKIPADTIAVHGITDADVAGKPVFGAVNGAFQAFVDDRLLIGHSIAYDFAVLKEEYRIAGLTWKVPRSLDVRTLARLVVPGLVDHSLDRLCEWLGVTIVGRHTALGDARATAEAYVRLVPLLRERGVRTLAEAEAACRELAEQDARAAGGLIATEIAQPTIPAALAKLDVFAFRHRVKDVMSSPPAILAGTVSVRDGITHLLDAGLSSTFVALGADDHGIVTERDALRTVAAHASAGLDMPLSSIAKRPLHDVMEHDHVYRAIGRMERLGIRHLAVRNSRGELVGALTPRNLLRNRATTVIAIGDRIAAAQSASELGACWAEIPAMVVNLLGEGVDARSIAGIISSEICAISKCAAELAEAERVMNGEHASLK